MLKAIIWDYGSVLSLPQSRQDIERLAQTCALPVDVFEKEYWLQRLEYDRGDFDGMVYWQEIGRRTGVEMNSERCRQLVDMDNLSWANANQATVAIALQLLERGVQAALLSNMPPDFRDFYRSGCPWLPAFAHRTLSCEVRTCKPDPAIYEHCLNGLSLSAAECVFVDDRQPNIDAAQELGINAVLFTDTQSTLDRLRSLFGIPVSA